LLNAVEPRRQIRAEITGSIGFQDTAVTPPQTAGKHWIIIATEQPCRTTLP